MISLYYGPVINPQTLSSYLALPRCLIAVAPDGNIMWIEEDINPSLVRETISARGLKDDDYAILDLSESPREFIMPGLIDTHIHACQFPILGVGGDSELIEWLHKYVFPVEKEFSKDAYAEKVYNGVIDRSIASGTTTSCYYGSLHLAATMILAKIVQDKGQRAFVGKCNMDYECPKDYIEQSAETSLEETKKLIEFIQDLPRLRASEPLVHPIITPRFALSCSDKLLTGLRELAASMPHVAIQTHISENREEISEVLKRFGESYAAVYDRFGLLRNNTILGHGVWLTEDEMDLIGKRGAGVAHCPTSNFYLSSGMAKVGALLDHHVKVGLGTDVSGGNNPSMLYAIQMASTASKMVSIQSQLDEERCEQRRKHREHGRLDLSNTPLSDLESDRKETHHCGQVDHKHHGHHHHHRHHAPKPAGEFTNKKLGVETLLYLATLGGANVCCLQDRIGSFAVGKAFDALHVSINNACENPAVWGAGVDEVDNEKEANEENLKRWLERFLFGGDNRNVRRVFVQGAVIGGVDANLAQSRG